MKKLQLHTILFYSTILLGLLLKTSILFTSEVIVRSVLNFGFYGTFTALAVLYFIKTKSIYLKLTQLILALSAIGQVFYTMHWPGVSIVVWIAFASNLFVLYSFIKNALARLNIHFVTLSIVQIAQVTAAIYGAIDIVQNLTFFTLIILWFTKTQKIQKELNWMLNIFFIETFLQAFTLVFSPY